MLFCLSVMSAGLRYGFTLRRLSLEEMAEAATVHKAAIDERLPSLAGEHTLAAVHKFYKQNIFGSH